MNFRRFCIGIQYSIKGLANQGLFKKSKKALHYVITFIIFMQDKEFWMNK